MTKKKSSPGGQAKASTTGKPSNSILPADASQEEIAAHVLKAVKSLRVKRGQVMEVRALDVPNRYGKPYTMAGWFDDLKALTASVLKLESLAPPGIFVTLNPVDPALLARAYNRLKRHPKATTTDLDIVRRLWLLFDIDPVRRADISSTPQEIEAAQDRAIEVERFLLNEFGERPDLRAFSGNGFHLLYRIDMDNTDEATESVRTTINIVADQLSDNRVTIDRSVFNAARIVKVYGTLARKGDEVPRQGRIHRRAMLIDNFQKFRIPC